MGTLIPLAPALTFSPTTIYGAVLLCWITQTGRDTPFQAAEASPSRSPPGLARSQAQVTWRSDGPQHQAEATMGR